MRMLTIFVVGAMAVGCSNGVPDPNNAMAQVTALTGVLRIQDGFIDAAADRLPNTMRIKRADTVEASALPDKICRMSRELHWGIQRVRMYPMDRADWTEATSLPELERDCP